MALEFTNVGAAFASRARIREGEFGIRPDFAITELAKFSPGALVIAAPATGYARIISLRCYTK